MKLVAFAKNTRTAEKTGRLKIFSSTTISGTPDEIEKIKELAKKNNKSVQINVHPLLHIVLTENRAVFNF